MPDVFWAAFGGGAAGSIFTLLAVILAELLRWRGDRPLVRVKVWWAFYQRSVSRETVRTISVDAINPHSKPVTLSSFGFGLRGRKSDVLVIPYPEPITLPYELHSGKSISEFCDPPKLFEGLRKAGRTPADLKFAWYRTQSSSKLYKDNLGKKMIDTLKNEFESQEVTRIPSVFKSLIYIPLKRLI